MFVKMVKVFAVLGLLMVSMTARAEYVCEVTLIDNLNGSTYGQNGFVLARYYTERSCGGSFIGQRWYCSNGATASGCAASSKYHYSELGLMSLYEKLIDAAFWNRQVRIPNVYCFGGSTECGGPVYLTSRY